MLDNTRSRLILPRWRDFEVTKNLGETSQHLVASGAVHIDSSIVDRADDFLDARNPWTAADLVSVAIAAGHPEQAMDAALFLADQSIEGRLLQKAVDYILGRSALPIASSEQMKASGNIADSEQMRAFAKIAEAKQRLRLYPRNAPLWIDLALSYVRLGQMSPAERCIEFALAISPTNRFVVRCASRFFIHAKQKERALQVVRSAVKVNTDPWLISVEIALSQLLGKPPSTTKQAARLIDRDAIDPFHNAEMASAFATLELRSGNARKAKGLFRNSLRNPNENVVAQAYSVDLGLRAGQLENIPLLYEATARSHFLAGEFDKAVEFTQRWMQDEPFSARPVVSLSYIYTVALCDFSTFAALRPTLKLHGDVPFLLDNNYAVCLAMTGYNVKAFEVMHKIKMETLAEDFRPTYLATMGLILYRQGHPAEGRPFYEKALTKFEVGSTAWLLGHLFLAVQEMDCGTKEIAQQIIQRVRERVAKAGAIEVITFLAWAEKRLQAGAD